MELPALRANTVEEMGVAAYHRYLKELSRVGHVAHQRLLAEIPEVMKRGLHRRWGFGSIHEYGARMANASRNVVDEVLRVHAAVGRYKRLWGLFFEGIVGWSVLKVIAPVVTPQTVGWWAKKLRTCKKRQLEDEVRRLRAASVGGVTTRVPTSGSQADGAGTRPERTDPALGRSAPGRPGDEHQKGLSLVRGGEEDLSSTRGNLRLTFDLGPEDAALLEVWQAQAEAQEGRAVTFGELLRRALRERVLNPLSSEGAREGQSSTGASEDSEAVRGGSARKRVGVPIRTLLVLYRNVDSGELHIPTRRGHYRVDPAAYAQVLGEARQVYLAELLEASRTKPARQGSRHVRLEHRLLAAARSGNRCLFHACGSLARELHHVEPHAENGASEEANLASLCALHHQAPHTGWIADHRGPVEGWRYLLPGEASRSGWADTRWQEVRASEWRTGTD